MLSKACRSRQSLSTDLGDSGLLFQLVYWFLGNDQGWWMVVEYYHELHRGFRFAIAADWPDNLISSVCHIFQILSK